MTYYMDIIVTERMMEYKTSNHTLWIEPTEQKTFKVIFQVNKTNTRYESVEFTQLDSAIMVLASWSANYAF